MQWDLGEFYQKGSVSTRWGTKEELREACSLAKQHSIDVLIDAVLNVWCLKLHYSQAAHFKFSKHKMGADRVEVFNAVPVDPMNRLREIGPITEIQVSRFLQNIRKSFISERSGMDWIRFFRERRKGKNIRLFSEPLMNGPSVAQRSSLEPSTFYR